LVKIGQNKSQKRNYNEAIEVLYNYKFKMNWKISWKIFIIMPLYQKP
jgi:hypothetical protein